MKKVFMAVVASVALAVAAQAAPQHQKITTVVLAQKTALVNLNKATAMQLQKLPGIGPKIAAEMIKNRPYKNGDDLQKKVRGIGPKVWSDIKALVTF